MNWSMKKKNLRPSLMNSTRPLQRCPVIKKKSSLKKTYLQKFKILTQSFTIQISQKNPIFWLFGPIWID